MVAIKAVDRRIISVDGEGNDIDGIHAYTMVCAADDRGYQSNIIHDGTRREMTETEMPNYGLRTYKILDFLISCRVSRSALVVSFAFTYDATKILSDVPIDKLRELSETEETQWNGYIIKHRPRKWLEVIDTRGGKMQNGTKWEWRRAVKVWDVFSYFQSSFVVALWRAKELFDPEVILEIADMKSKRSQFENESTDDILAYCYRECRYLSTLCRDLFGHIEAVGIPMKSYDGPGSLAAGWFTKEGIKDYISLAGLPESVALAGYYGGRFEVSHTGYVGDGYAYDINSAYPHIATSLPCLVHGMFRQTTEFVPGKIGIYRVQSHTSGRWAPFPFRIPKELSRERREENRLNDVPTKAEIDRNISVLSAGTVAFPHGGERWIWQDELAIARKHFGADALPILDGWVLESTCNHKPFAKLTELYAERKRLKKEGNGAEKALKLLINSIYGKTAQSIGWVGIKDSNGTIIGAKRPPFQSYIWAGLITSGCRAMVLDAILTKGSDVVSVATDGIISRTPIDWLPISGNLGDWDYEEYRNVYLFQSGVYSYETYDDVLDKYQCKTGEKEWTAHTKTRGYALRDLPTSKMIDAWNDGAWYVESTPYNVITGEGPRGFIPLKLGLQRKNPLAIIGQWVPYTKRVSFDPSKRAGRYVLGNDLMPDREGNLFLTDPYDLPDEAVSMSYEPRQSWQDILIGRLTNEEDYWEPDDETIVELRPNDRPKRVLITGSRDWGKGSADQRKTLTDALTAAYTPGAVLVSGACPTGADALAERLWRQLGGTVERHPAEWRSGRSAGSVQNAHMISTGADVCIAFIRNGSPDTSGCARMAEDAGIQVERFTD